MHAPPPILVTGTPRSGTSMIAGCLARCGAFCGETLGPSPENPEGFYEHGVIREYIVKKILAGLGADPLAVDPLPTLDGVRALGHLEGLATAVVECLSVDGWDQTTPWLYKDPKLALLWPLWLHAFPTARWIVTQRPIRQSVDSCLKAPFLAQRSQDPDFWRGFLTLWRQRLKSLENSGAPVFLIEPGRLVNGDFEELAELVDWLDLTWNEAEVRSFVKPRHWHVPA